MPSSYLFTSESASEGHPDKVADQISDAPLDVTQAQDRAAALAATIGCSPREAIADEGR